MSYVTQNEVRALSKLVEQLGETVWALGQQLSGMDSKYKKELAQAAATALPEVSNKVRAQLEREHPQFMSDPAVRESFQQHKKVLGWFKPSGYAEALAMLQARMAQHLESSEAFKRQAAEYRRISELRNRTALQLRSLKELEATVRALYQKNVPVDSLTHRRLGTLLNGPAKKERVPVTYSGSTYRGFTSTKDVGVDTDDVSDLLIWLSTETPVSLRTLMLDAMTAHAEEATPAARVMEAPSAREVEMPASRCEAPMSSTSDIATDDRLGCFS